MTTKTKPKKTEKLTKVIIKKCHVCGALTESENEIERCAKCNKAFLPLKYFNKIHENQNTQFKDLFSSSEDITDEDLIKGIYVLW
ncbi:MAG: hypothetical protein JNM93_14075 [Bacteriovoracaceae bacterium]|nr:hypothetical protein [Bacteriovoracaceae bacterium]